MKFLCPNCKAKYRIGPEKMAGRQAAKIRCRKCEYLIQIAYRADSDEFDVTATPPTIPPTNAAGPRPAKANVGQPAAGPGAARPRLPPLGKEEGNASKKPTAAVPGLPGLGSAKSTRGAALLSDSTSLARRPLAPLPPPPTASPAGSGASAGGGSLSSGLTASVPAVSAVSSVPVSGPLLSSVPAAAPASTRTGPTSTQLGDQFRESVQAGAAEELPQEGWFVGVNGVPLGPIPLNDLRELAIAGHIDRRSLVWREGQAEWRPLGKFQGLARVIDDGAPVPTPQPEPPAPAPAPAPSARPNGTSNGHLATGFDVKRADAGERPSVWGDLDDEDDDDEQPTTVKGRVSVFPSSTGLPAPTPPASLPPPPRPVTSTFPAALPGSASGRPAGVTATVSAFHSVSPLAPSSAPGPSAIGAGPSLRVTADPGLDPDASLMRSPNRARWSLIIAAVLFAFALGAIVTYVLRPSASSKHGKSAVSGDADGAGVAHVPGPAGVSADESDLDEPALRGAGVPVAHERVSHGASESIFGASVAVVPELGSVAKPTASASKWGGNSPRVAPRAVRGRGLDETALQRTYRRYTPAVRQECWQRALDTRTRGVPSSARIVASISIDSSGRVRTATVAGAPRGYPGLGRCIERSLTTWQFPRSSGQTLADVPFLFTAQQKRD
jgi:predicted Zn finger-like uncharacterized protein